MTETPIENEIGGVLFYVGFLWMDRILVRLAILSPILLIIFLLYEPARQYDMLIILTTLVIASSWAIADLYRGIELDHKHKDRLLKDSLIKND